MKKIVPTDSKTVKKPAKGSAVKNSSLDENRNTSSAEPADDEELADNFAGADSSLEKPRDQES